LTYRRTRTYRSAIAAKDGTSVRRTVPLIQIDLDRELFDNVGDQLSAAVHKAQIEALDIPSELRPWLQRGGPAKPASAPRTS